MVWPNGYDRLDAVPATNAMGNPCNELGKGWCVGLFFHTVGMLKNSVNQLTLWGLGSRAQGEVISADSYGSLPLNWDEHVPCRGRAASGSRAPQGVRSTTWNR
jgi:hypothetical protein